MNTAVIAFPRYLRAEAIRLKSSSVLYFSLIGLLLSVLSVVLSTGARGAGYDSMPFSWQVMYVTGMAAPLMMLLAALSEQRERAARNGGISWRGASEPADRLARLCGVAAVSAVFQALSFGGVALLIGSHAATATIAGLYALLGSLGLLGLGAIVARKFGTIAALLVGIVWQFIGVMSAEFSVWWLFPPAWPIRIMLVPVGVQVNGVPITPDYPAAQESPMLGLVLCAFFAFVMFAAATRVQERQPSRRRKAVPRVDQRVESAAPFALGSAVSQARRNPKTMPIGAALSSLRGSGVLTAVVLSVAAIAFASIMYSPSIVTSFFGFAIFPIGVGILPVLTWRVNADTHTQTYSENPRISVAFGIVHALVLSVLVTVMALALLVGGEDVVRVLGLSILWIMVGTCLLFTALALMVRFGASGAISAMILWTIIGMTLGGDVLADTFLWIVAFPVWPQLASTPGRFLIALPLAAVACVVSTYLLRASLRRHRRNE